MGTTAGLAQVAPAPIQYPFASTAGLTANAFGAAAFNPLLNMTAGLFPSVGQLGTGNLLTQANFGAAAFNPLMGMPASAALLPSAGQAVAGNTSTVEAYIALHGLDERAAEQL